MANKAKLTKKEKFEALRILFEYFPDARPELDYNNEFELLCAVLLSAQTTDVQVNKVTPALFEKYPTPYDYKDADLKDIEDKIRSIGLYKTKAKNLKKMANILVDKYNGKVPNTREELVKLPGVGRKTANVVLSVAFGIPAIAVDTHVHRTANRIGLVDSKTVEETEEQLMNLLPEDMWFKTHHVLIFYGRRISKAKNPDIENDPIKHISLHCRGLLDPTKK